MSDDRYGSVVYTVDVGEKFKLDDRNIVIDELVYYEDEVMEVRYYMWYDIFPTALTGHLRLEPTASVTEKEMSITASAAVAAEGDIILSELY